MSYERGDKVACVRTSGDLETWTFVRYFKMYGHDRVTLEKVCPTTNKMLYKSPKLGLFVEWQLGHTHQCNEDKRPYTILCDECNDGGDCRASCVICQLNTDEEE